MSTTNPSSTDLNHHWIAAHIPHSGSMCLLNQVLEWDSQHIVCDAMSHSDTQNPLRAADRLGASIGVEYAAQAMAVHGALLSPSAAVPTQGYLTSIRGLRLHVDRLDDRKNAIRIHAQRILGDARLILYQFSIEDDERCLLEGKASVVLDTNNL